MTSSPSTAPQSSKPLLEASDGRRLHDHGQVSRSVSGFEGYFDQARHPSD